MNHESGKPRHTGARRILSWPEHLSSGRDRKCALGPHASEEHMPQRIATALENEGTSTSLYGVIPKLASLLESSRDVETAYLCHKETVQVQKLRTEGNTFCGYRNIEMLSLALGYSGVLPDLQQRHTVLELQDMIEQAWKNGFNSDCYSQTGGIRGTRKYIGTPEAEAFFLNLGIACTGSVFEGKDAYTRLLDFVEKYFSNCKSSDMPAKVRMTASMPIFLQRPRHSVTVVGISRLRNGKRALLVFDPALPPPLLARTENTSKFLKAMQRKVDLAAYQRVETYLRHYTAFETLSIDMHAAYDKRVE